MNPSSQQQELRDALRPFCDEILRQGAQLYKDGRLLGGRAEVDAELRKIMATIHSHMQAGFDAADRNGYMRGISDFSGYFMDASIAAQRTLISPDIARELRDNYRTPTNVKVKGAKYLKGEL